MHTSILHINTSLLPIYFGGAAIALHNAGRIFNRSTLKAISYRLYFLTSLVTTMTCGFGGASIRMTETIPGVNSSILKTHAWTAMTVFLLSLIMAFYSYKALRGKGEEIRNDKILFAVSVLFLVVFACTTYIAYKIR